jgi:hypothetical protein
VLWGLGEGIEVNQYVQEACYYLHKKGLSFSEISKALEIPEDEAARLHREYSEKIEMGTVRESDLDRNLWEDIYHDSFGDEKVTFVRDNGFFHCRKTDLENMASDALMSIFETSKKFLDFDMYKPYLNSKTPVGYDPMALQRQVKRSIELIQEILDKRWKQGTAKD